MAPSLLPSNQKNTHLVTASPNPNPKASRIVFGTRHSYMGGDGSDANPDGGGVTTNIPPSESSTGNTHPLQRTWCVWEHQAAQGGRAASSSDWGSNMKTLGEFSTVEDFWRYYNNIPKPSAAFYDGRSKKKVGGDRTIESFSVFKKGIRPEWEDKANASGCEWSVKLTSASITDSCWENILLGLIGETIDSADDICGVRVVDKSRGNVTHRIEIWLRTREQIVADLIKEKAEKSMADGLNGFLVPHMTFKNH